MPQKEDVVSVDDPLTWWKCHETSFPIISKLARKYLAIPASTAPRKTTAKNILQTETFAKSAQ